MDSKDILGLGRDLDALETLVGYSLGFCCLPSRFSEDWMDLW